MLRCVERVNVEGSFSRTATSKPCRVAAARDLKLASGGELVLGAGVHALTTSANVDAQIPKGVGKEAKLRCTGHLTMTTAMASKKTEKIVVSATIGSPEAN